METLGNEIGAKKGKKGQIEYYCEKCDFKCCKKYSWERHITTTKHLQETDGSNLGAICAKKGQKYSCQNCEKCFQTNAGLWKHKQKCSQNTIQHNNVLSDKDSLIIELLKQNKELLEIVKNGTHNITHTNSHNKAFNLNFFLNETCKDAMNIMDFVDSIKLQLSDLEGVGELGYVEGISKIIVKNLKELDVTQRPVHCTDQKRETMYIKDDDKWEKDEERLKLHKVVRRVTCKNQNLIPKFKEAHPDYNKYHSKVSDQYNKIIVESMGGPGDNDFEKEEKIIKNISKQVYIDKAPV
jgi:hypothetical protein